MKEKKRSSGGAVLLAKKGPEYFRQLAIKKAEIQRKAMKLWKKTQAEKSASSVKVKGK